MLQGFANQLMIGKIVQQMYEGGWTMHGQLYDIKKNQGSALVIVIFVLLFVSFLIAAATVLTQGNTRQAAYQEQGMQSYYIARSGAELAFQVLLTSSPSLLTQFEAATNPANTIVLSENSVNLGEGTADIRVTSYDEGTNRRIRITSIGTASDSNIARTVELNFDLASQRDLVWAQ